MYTSRYLWDDLKNAKLKKERGIGFEEIVELLRTGVWYIEESQSSQHFGQLRFIIKKDPNPYVVPFRRIPAGEILLITIYPSRKYRNNFKDS